MVRTWAILTVALALAVPGHAQSARKPRTAPDTELWRSIRARQTALADAPDPRAARLQLLEAIRDYRAYYPGGRSATAAMRLEFDLLFEIGAMDGDFAALAAACKKPQSDAESASEVAYWKMVIDRVALDREQTRALPGPLESLPALPVEASAAFVEKYPSSRHTPRLVEALFNADATDGVPPRAALVALLRAQFPNHLTTRALAARLEREARLGQPMALRATAISGETIDAQNWRGRPTLVVFFSVANAESMRRLRDAAALAAARDMRLVGVHVGLRRADAQAALERDKITCPVICDEAGLFGDLPRDWGVTAGGLVLVVDRATRLRGIERENWREIAESVAN